MFLDHLQHSSSYESLHPLFPQAFDSLRKFVTQPDLPDGRIDIDGERIYALIMEGSGQNKDQARGEAHRRYIDIQYTCRGSEVIGWIPIAECKHALGYEENRDVEFFEDREFEWFSVPAGYFAVFLPHDVHAPMAGDAGMVKKIVIKIAVETA
jgi:biofilm protein TabA